jgi:hypothetical protein
MPESSNRADTKILAFTVFPCLVFMVVAATDPVVQSNLLAEGPGFAAVFGHMSRADLIFNVYSTDWYSAATLFSLNTTLSRNVGGQTVRDSLAE